MKGSIYIIRNTINDKVYIGQTIQSLNQRMRSHRKDSRYNKNKNIAFYNAMSKYGVENFHIELLEDNIPVEKLDEREIYYINKYNVLEKGYNVARGGRTGKRFDLPLEELKSMYAEGMTLKEIGRKFNCDKAVISNRLKGMGIDIRDWNDIQRIEIDKNDLERLYIEEMKSTPEIAEIYNTSEQTIRKRLIKYGIPARRSVNRKYLEPMIDKETLYKLYVTDRLSALKISRIYNISDTTVRKYIQRFDIPKH